jgi:3-hydroxyacyl-CoA dehydrogenase/3a,7a,12a-trihydroxy-5b-cholest-24-enoyl-CoA hydratase
MCIQVIFRYVIYISVGYTTKDEDYLKFLFEGSEDFSVVPSFCILPSQASTFGSFSGGVPGLGVDVTKVRSALFMHIHFWNTLI